MNLAKILSALIAGLVIGVFLPIRPATLLHANRLREFYAWEKTPQGQYKQVRKNYFMDEAICRNVIDVLNAMSTKQAASNWVLSHTTDSTFECWPADIDPNRRKQEFSTHGDEPIPTNVHGDNAHGR